MEVVGGAFLNDIVGNRIGTNAAGTSAIPNEEGVVISGAGTGSNDVGGATAGSRNIISGNTGAGVALRNGSDASTVRENWIGLDVTGTNSIPNQDGVVIESGSNTHDIRNNVISNNTNDGIRLTGAGVTSILIANNTIGLSAVGTIDLGNGGNGVAILGGASINSVGAAAAFSLDNTIAHNGGDGVLVSGGSTGSNEIRSNSIHSNGGLGINLVSEGNNNQPAPVIDSVVGNIVSGSGCSGCYIEVFSDDGDEGRVYEGSTDADGPGNWEFEGPLSGPNITVTGTHGDTNDTSEFSAPFVPPPPAIGNLTLDVTESTVPAAASEVPIANIPVDALPPSAELPSAPLSSIEIQDTPLSSIPLSSIPLSSIPLSSIPLSSIPLSSIGISRPGGWEAILEQTEFKGTPTQNVTLEQLLESNAPALQPGSPAALQLGELDLASTALRSLGLASIAMSTLPLSSIDLLPTGGDTYTEWCNAIAAAGSSCAALDITPGNLGDTSIVSLNLRGVPLSSIPLSSIPLSSIPLSSIPLSSIPLSSIPLSSIPLSSIPLSSIPLSSIALGVSPLSSIPLSSIPLDTGQTFCQAYEPSPQACQARGLSDSSTLQQTVVALQAVSIDPMSTPLSSIAVERIPLSSIPLSSIRLGTSPLSSIPLSSIPLSSIGGDTTFCEAFPTWHIAPMDCGTLGLSDGSTLQATLVALEGISRDPATTPLSSIPLSSIPLSSIPLSSIPLSSIPLSSIGITGALLSSPLSSIPLSSIPLSSIAPNSVPLSSIELSEIPLSSIAPNSSPLSSIPLSSIPLSSIASAVDCSAPIDCSAGSDDTLGDAADAGKILLGGNLSHLFGALGNHTLGDLASTEP